MKSPESENPITRAIAAGLRSRRLKSFVRDWDALEALVIRVYKANNASGQDQTEHARLRGRLLREYPLWEASLAAYWPRTRVAGQPASQDPIASLLNTPEAGAFVDNWHAMQTLPAAREALNQFLVELQE